MSDHEHPEQPVPGRLWLGTYDIIEELPDGGSGLAWKARIQGAQKVVQIRTAKSIDAGRAQAWERLQKLPTNVPILRPHARHELGGRCYEVYDHSSLPNLVEWRQKHGVLSEAELCACVSAVAEGLLPLHRAGLVHLALRPDTLLIDHEGQSLRILISGLELCTVRDQAGLIHVPVDPLFAPPEVVGLFKHQPGDTLIAWDSFSLGRVVQHLVLGRHILAFILNRDFSTWNNLPPELRDRAEALATEKYDGHLRAGALEPMTELPARVEKLLRGLLSSSMDARWRDEELVLWMDGGLPREHYSLHTKDRCYRHAGQACTVPEAAEQLRSAEHWDEATSSLFEPDTPGTLAHYLKDHASAELRNKLKVIEGLSTEPWMTRFPPEAQRDVLTAITLQQLSGGLLIWRGRRLDAALLLEMLEREDGSGQWLARARLLCTPAILALLDLTDAEASRVLGEIGRHAKKAEDKARNQRWLAANDLLASANLWRLSCALQKVPALIANLRANYACSTKPEVQAIFSNEKPGIDEQLLLCHLATSPAAHGFLTHEEHAARRYGDLYAEGIHIAEMLFWKRLRRALATGPWWFGNIWWMVGIWGFVALLVAFLKPGPGWLVVALLPAALAAGMRALLVGNLQPLLAIHFPKAPAWRFLDGPARCNVAASELRTSNELAAILNNINAEITGLKALQPPPPKVVVPPSFAGLRNTALASWLVLLCVLGVLCWQALVAPPSLDAFLLAWKPKPEKLVLEEGEEAREPVADTRIVWPHTRIPQELRIVVPLEQRPPTRQQEQQALRLGQALTARYLPNTITVAILVPLPAEKHALFALYDGRKRALASKNLVVLRNTPMPRTWLEIDGRPVYVHTE